jgi:3'-phosphoadenosine 5'-phosphosulfate sulfotransferase (PAPS reductase)/FAD synthetase
MEICQMSPLDRHEKIVLQFSGGKDSLACLLLLKEHLHRITVVWVNTGAAFPETLAQMDAVRAMCPHFIEVQGRQPEQIAGHGFPVDVLPMRNHLQIQYVTQQKRIPLQGFMQCCFNSLMLPMHEATLAMGATLIIRGQKTADHHKNPVKSGDVVDGVEYWFPVENWTDAQVLDYVRDSGLLPAHYDHANTSLDCWSCTAYLSENKWKLPYLKKHHPEKAEEVERRLNIIRQEIKADMAFLEE